jgi:hypothetical protein
MKMRCVACGILVQTGKAFDWAIVQPALMNRKGTAGASQFTWATKLPRPKLVKILPTAKKPASPSNAPAAKPAVAKTSAATPAVSPTKPPVTSVTPVTIPLKSAKLAPLPARQCLCPQCWGKMTTAVPLKFPVPVRTTPSNVARTTPPIAANTGASNVQHAGPAVAQPNPQSKR